MSIALLFVFFAMFVLINDKEKRSLVKKNKHLSNVANFDELTKLMNRKPLRHYFEEFVKMANEKGSDFTLLMCDIDDFKAVNDTYGHSVGDEVLKTIAATIQRQLREEDVAFRWGGEEILVLVSSGIQGGTASAERCRKSVESKRIVCDSATVSATVTIGVCPYWTGATLDQMVKRADAALYAGKNNGKNCVTSYTEETVSE